MAEYIEREALIAKLCGDQCRCCPPPEEPCNNCYEVSTVANFPAADVAPVVRCRHCYAHGRCGAEKIYLSEGIEDPFCCRGARKEGNGE